MPGPGKFSVPTFLFVFLSQIPAFMLEFPVFHACSCAIRPTKDAFPPSVRPSRPPAEQKNETQPRRAGLRFLCQSQFFRTPYQGIDGLFLAFPLSLWYD